MSVIYSAEVKLVLEQDGTEIDDSQVLFTMKDNVLMILGLYERWRPGRFVSDETR